MSFVLSFLHLDSQIRLRAGDFLASKPPSLWRLELRIGRCLGLICAVQPVVRGADVLHIYKDWRRIGLPELKASVREQQMMGFQGLRKTANDYVRPLSVKISMLTALLIAS